MIDAIFRICNLAVLPFWVLLILFPRARATRLLVHGPLVPILLGVVYGVGLFTMPPVEGGGFGSLPGVMKLFSAPQGVLVGWVHYLIFDLFIGAWEARDAQRLRISHLALCPCLVLTLMIGPLGLLCYLALRAALRRRVALQET